MPDAGTMSARLAGPRIFVDGGISGSFDAAGMRRVAPILVWVLGIGHAGAAFGLDKQGSAHGGTVAGDGGDVAGVGLSGGLSAGLSLVNPSYAARPDNTGLALARYAGHLDLDVLGRYLSVPLDVNLFTDRQRHGAGKLAPTELDLIGGVTSTLRAGPGAVELGVRAEQDRAVDHQVTPQTYVDVRARYLWSLAALLPHLRSALRDGDVCGHATLGWFAYNQTYFARPDNTGLALLRYGAHVEVALWHSQFAVALDAAMFTDRRQNPLRPSELDLTPEFIFRRGDFELHLAWERDRPLDSLGRDPAYTQQFVYLLGAWAFTLGPH